MASKAITTPPAAITTSAPASVFASAAGSNCATTRSRASTSWNAGTEIGEPVDLHPVHRDEAVAQPVADDVLDDARSELLVERDQREIRPTDAGDVTGRLAQAEHRNIRDLAPLPQSGIGDVADQECIEPLRSIARCTFSITSAVSRYSR